MQTDIDNLCRNITALRVKNELSLKEMANILKISPRKLRLIELGKLPPGFRCDILAQIQHTFGVRIYRLFLDCNE